MENYGRVIGRLMNERGLNQRELAVVGELAHGSFIYRRVIQEVE